MFDHWLVYPTYVQTIHVSNIIVTWQLQTILFLQMLKSSKSINYLINMCRSCHGNHLFSYLYIYTYIYIWPISCRMGYQYSLFLQIWWIVGSYFLNMEILDFFSLVVWWFGPFFSKRKPFVPFSPFFVFWLGCKNSHPQKTMVSKVKPDIT